MNRSCYWTVFLLTLYSHYDNIIDIILIKIQEENHGSQIVYFTFRKGESE